MILDAGAFLALERGDRSMWRRLKTQHLARSDCLTHGGVVAQVWRGGSGRQALLASAFGSIRVVPLDARLGRRAGTLLARSRMADAIDAAVVAMAGDEDVIMTSDPLDINSLVIASTLRIDVVAV